MINRKMLYSLLFLALAIGAALMVTANKDGSATDRVGNSAEGGKLYTANCASCHGDQGEGKKGLGRALNDARYLQTVSNAQIWSDIAYGREKTAMGPSLKGLQGVKQLTKEQINDLVAYIRSFQKEVQSPSKSQ
jgi:mono/diheme cytochrome c family protein